MEITLTHYLILSAVMFGIGIVGFVSRRNMVTVLMCIELMLNAVNINFIAFAKHFQSMNGQVISLFIITLAAAEAAVGLAIIVVLFRGKRTINIDELDALKH